MLYTIEFWTNIWSIGDQYSSRDDEQTFRPHKRAPSVAIRSSICLGAQSSHSGAQVRGRRDKFAGASCISTPMTFIRLMTKLPLSASYVPLHSCWTPYS